jgi:hypothetical protein
MRSHNDSIDTTHTPPPLSFYNTFNVTFHFETYFEKTQKLLAWTYQTMRKVGKRSHW